MAPAATRTVTFTITVKLGSAAKEMRITTLRRLLSRAGARVVEELNRGRYDVAEVVSATYETEYPGGSLRHRGEVPELDSQ